jgi:histidinol phosphatase-like enzyme
LNIGHKEYVNNPAELVLLKGAGYAIAKLRKAGFRICVVTNQSPIGRGLWSHADLAAIHDELIRQLLEEDENGILDLILYAPQTPWEGGPSRKPGAGMLQVGRQLLEGNWPSEGLLTGPKYHLWAGKRDETPRSFMAGDRAVDLQAGRRHAVRLFNINPAVGLAGAVERMLDADDSGDELG